MLTIAISLLLALAAFAAIAVIHASLVAGARRARAILAELDAIERRARASTRPAASRPQWAGFPPALAAA